jgi:hypothetical protein
MNKLLIVLLLTAFASCKVTKHIQRSYSDSTEHVKKDSVGSSEKQVQTVEHVTETKERKLDTIIQQKPINAGGETSAPTITDNVKTVDLLDDLGKTVGKAKLSLDTISGKLKLSVNVQPEPVHAVVNEKESKQSDKTTNGTEKSTANVNTNTTVAVKKEEVKKDVTRKPAVFAWIAIIAGTLGLAYLVWWLYKKYKKINPL